MKTVVIFVSCAGEKAIEGTDLSPKERSSLHSKTENAFSAVNADHLVTVREWLDNNRRQN